jgi:basic membrane protein A and related proteins
VKTRMTISASVALVAVLATAVAVALAGGTAKAAPQATLKVGLVTDIGGLNDRGFNALAAAGANQAKKALGVNVRILTSKSNADYIPNLSTLARQNYDLIIGVGFLMTDAMDTVASKFPNTDFAIIDVDVTGMKHKPKNVRGLLFREQEAGYLVGYAAGLWLKLHPSDAQMIGSSVGGLKIPPVDRYIAGYQYGLKKANPGTSTDNGYSQDFVDQAKCKELALNQIANGAGVVFQVAGGCGLGALDAAKEKNVMGIGVDADQSYLGTHVMTSALKKVDAAVYQTIGARKKSGPAFRGGYNAIFDAKTNGVGIGKWSPKVPASIRTAVAGQLKLLQKGLVKGIPQSVK